MHIQANKDVFGHKEHFTADMFRRILDLIDGYMKGEPYYIHEIYQDDIEDKNGRIDIEIIRNNSNGAIIMQKLLILNDELIDGKTFHKRRKEWYS